MMPLPLVYALLLALELLAPGGAESGRPVQIAQLDVIHQGALEYELALLAAGEVRQVETRYRSSPGDTPAENELLFEVERSERYGDVYTVFFPDRHPAVFDLGDLQSQLVAAGDAERFTLQVSSQPPAMGSPRDSGSATGSSSPDGDGATGETAADDGGDDSSPAGGEEWQVVRRNDGVYLSAPSLNRVIVLDR